MERNPASSTIWAASLEANPPCPLKRFASSPEDTWLVVMMYVHLPMSLRKIEDLQLEREIDICHETVGFGGTGSARGLQQRSIAKLTRANA